MTEPARLCLLAPPIGTADLAARLAAALDAGRIDAVVLTWPEGDETALVDIAAALVAIVQDRGAAALLAGRADLVARIGADGVHLDAATEIAPALAVLKPKGAREPRIVGAGGVLTRDAAMEAGEAGCDYVMFGEPGREGLPPLDWVIDRAAWWAQLFETPCVAFAPSLDAVGPLAATGAEFVALGPALFEEGNGPAEIVRAALAAIEAVGR